MTDLITANETAFRLGVFLSVLCVMLLLEITAPRKARAVPSGHRRVSNFALIIVDSLFVRLIFPVAAVGVAIIAADKNWGVFNAVDLPLWAECGAAIIILDMMIYWQHVASHKIPLLWALHKVHHADRDIDVTTGFRFHPFEITLSMGYKMALIVLLGAPVIAVIIFEIILNACAMFNHSNIRLPAGMERRLRRVIVTPDMHRIHHSVLLRESGSNYGFSTSLWDYLFRSYIAKPKGGHDSMTIGLTDYQSGAPSSLLWSLAFPFKAVKRLATWL